MNERTTKQNTGRKDKREGNRLADSVHPAGDGQRVKALEDKSRDLAERNQRIANDKKASFRSSGSDPDSSTSGSDKSSHHSVKGVYYLMMAGLSISIVLLFIGMFQFLVPKDISADGTLTVEPNSLNSGNIVSYKINGCDPSKKYEGTTAVTLESRNDPPLLSIALNLPITQVIQCGNAVLIPAVIPTGEYKLKVYITYDVNPVRNLLNPVTHEYVSGTIRIKNDNPQYVLPTINVK